MRSRKSKERHPDGFEIVEGRQRAPGKRWRRAWFWRLYRKGRIVADGGEGYASKSNAVRAVWNLTDFIAYGSCLIRFTKWSGEEPREAGGAKQ